MAGGKGRFPDYVLGGAEDDGEVGFGGNASGVDAAELGPFVGKRCGQEGEEEERYSPHDLVMISEWGRGWGDTLRG